MKKISLFVILFFAFSQTVSADQKLVYILKWTGNPYWQALKEGIEDTSKELGVKSIVLSPTNDQLKEEHLNLCQTAISQNASFIAIGAATTSIGLECMKLAKSKGIPVADIDATIMVEEAQKAGVELVFSIGADNKKIGQISAEFANSKIAEQPIQALILEGVIGSPPSTDRVAGFKQRILELRNDAKIINSISADWDRLRALNITADTLVRSPAINLIFAANDVMALGASQAVEAGKNSSKRLIIGVDGVPDARKAILAGKLSASITQLPYLIGKRAVEKALDILAKKNTDQIERAPLLILTKEVLQENKDPLLKYVR